MSVRLYGRDIGNGSLAVVTRGFREALGDLVEGFVAIDRSGGSEEDASPPGALARDGVFTGDLRMAPVMQRGAKHERHWVQVTPNSTYVPRELLAAVLKLPEPTILSCSIWGTEMIADALAAMGCRFVSIEAGATGSGRVLLVTPDERAVGVLTVRHGISGFAPHLENIEQARIDYESGHFRVVHFSTTQGERKGTLELIKAWMWCAKELPPHAQLQLVLDHPARLALQQRLLHEEIMPPSSVVFVPRGNLAAASMSEFLCHHHLLAAPSRGEGFGLCPLQARACGVPVVATTTTGHSAGHVEGPGVLTIEQPPWLEPIDDGPAAMAPPLYPGDIANQLVAASKHWRARSEAALRASPHVIEEWSWKKQLQPLVEELRR